jgi:hypothetical protein
MKVWVHDNGAGDDLKRIPAEFAAAGRDAVSLVMFCVFLGMNANSK